MLYNAYSKYDYSFKINVTNQAPKLLNGKFPDFKIPINTVYTYNFSEGVDPEKQKIKYEANERYKQLLPPFMMFKSATREFKFSPTKLDAIKDYHIELTLIDNFNARTTYPFIVTL